jgi:tetratricopeptide (TPR) repeat protein
MTAPNEIDEIKSRLEAAYAGIRELDEDLAAGRLSAGDHADLKRRSERQAAGLLKQLRQAEQGEERRPPPAGRPGPALGARLKSPVGLTIAGVLLVVVGVALGVLLGRSTSDERAAAMAPNPAAGRAAGPVSTELDALRKEVETDDAPTRKLLGFAHLALDEGQLPAAIWAYKRVLAREPKNVEAITHVGIILYQGQHVEQALAKIDDALRIDPSYAHAHWDRAQILFTGKKDYAAAQRALEGFLALVPVGEDADRARAMLGEARRQAGARDKGNDRADARPPADGRSPGK